jgi:hypothetical protein
MIRFHLPQESLIKVGYSYKDAIDYTIFTTKVGSVSPELKRSHNLCKESFHKGTSSAYMEMQDNIQIN